MGKEEQRVLNIHLLAAHKFQPISKNKIATYLLVYLGHNMKNITFFYHMAVAEVF